MTFSVWNSEVRSQNKSKVLDDILKLTPGVQLGEVGFSITPK